MAKQRTREERAAAGEVLIARDRVLARMRVVTKRAADEAAAESQRRDRETAAVVAALLLVGRRLSAALGEAVIRGRAEARMAARRRLRAELLAAGALAALPSQGRPRESRDATAAAKVAAAVAAQWRAIAVLAVRASAREERDPAVALRATARAVDARLGRAAVTETARAYGSEHRQAAIEYAAANPEAASKLLREWSAMIEACDRCWPHDGERTGLDESFSGGDEPGAMHPHCACVDTIVAA